MRKLVLHIVLLTSLVAQGQNKGEATFEKQLLTWYETRLMAVGNDLVECREEKDRDSCLHLFNKLMDTAIHLPGAYQHPFDSVRNVAKVQAPDNSFRVFTWTFRSNRDSFTYYGLVQFPAESDHVDQVVYLHDSSARMDDKRSLYQEYDHDKWYGALYYDIAQTKRKGTTYYTLIGWDGYTRRSTKKVLDVIWFDDQEVKFGMPLFKMDKTGPLQYRVIWEYADDAVMALHYEKRKDIITYEHLVPPSEMAKEEYHLYLPDGTYDFFEWKKGEWVRKDMRFEVRPPTEDQ